MNYLCCDECEVRLPIGEAAYHWNEKWFCTSECVTDAMEKARIVERFVITKEDCAEAYDETK